MTRPVSGPPTRSLTCLCVVPPVCRRGVSTVAPPEPPRVTWQSQSGSPRLSHPSDLNDSTDSPAGFWRNPFMFQELEPVPCPSLSFRSQWLSWVIPDGSVWATPGGSPRATADNRRRDGTAERGRVAVYGSSRPVVAANLCASGPTIRSESRKPGGILRHGACRNGACLTRRRLLIELAVEPRLIWGGGGISEVFGVDGGGERGGI